MSDLDVKKTDLIIDSVLNDLLHGKAIPTRSQMVILAKAYSTLRDEHSRAYIHFQEKQEDLKDSTERYVKEELGKYRKIFWKFFLRKD